MEKLTTIDLNSEATNIDIINIRWADYSSIMISLERTIKQLEKPLDDIYFNQHREKLLKQYQDLFEQLKSKDIPWRGQAVSLDDNVLDLTK